MSTSIMRAQSLPGMLPSGDERCNSTPSATTKVCVTCGATKTPMWRTNTDGQKTLCNACGVRLHREQKKSKASTTAQLREVVPPAPDSHAAVPEADSHLLLRSRAATCHAPAGPGTDQQRPIVFRGDVAAGYDGGLLRKRTSQEGRISPRPKASRTRSMPEPTARGIPTDTTISWIMQQLKHEVLRSQRVHGGQQQPSTSQPYRAALPPLSSPYASLEAQLYLHPAWSSYERAPLQQPAWRQACSGPELGMCTAGDVLLAASCSQPAQALSPYRRPAALFPPALPQDSPADLDPLDPRFLAHISDPSEHLDALPSSPIEQTSFESEDTFLRLGGGDAEAEAEFPSLRMPRGSFEGLSPAGMAATHRAAFPSSQGPGSPPRRGPLPVHHGLSAAQDYHTILNYEKQLADFSSW